MTEENNQTQEKKWTNGNEKTLKFITICLCAFLGGFVSVFALNSLLNTNQTTIYYPLNTKDINDFNMMNEFHDFDDYFFKNSTFEYNKKNPFKTPINKVINIEENEKNYKVFINLKKFNNNENNIQIELKPHLIKIKGKTETKKENEQNSFFYEKTFSTSKTIETDEIKKEKIGDNYIITIPIED